MGIWNRENHTRLGIHFTRHHDERRNDLAGARDREFGDQYGAGHGAHAASGSLKFTLTSFTIQ